MACLTPCPAADMAIVHRVARAIHEKRQTPNQADQIGKDMVAAYEILETIQHAGLTVADPAALGGSAPRVG